METSSYITLPVVLTCSHTNNPQGKEFTLPSQELLQCTLQGANINGNQLLSAHPRAQHRSWCSLTSQTWMIWVMHHNCPLTGLASSNSLKMPLMSMVMLGVHLPPCPHALLNDPRQPCWRGRAASGTLQMPGEPDQSLVPPHLPGLQLPVEPNPNTTPCWTQSDSQRTGSAHTAWGWGVPLFVLGVCKWAPHDLCTASGQETCCRFLATQSPNQNIGMVESSSSLSALCCNDFLLPGDLKGSWDICEVRKEITLT